MIIERKYIYGTAVEINENYIIFQPIQKNKKKLKIYMPSKDIKIIKKQKNKIIQLYGTFYYKGFDDLTLMRFEYEKIGKYRQPKNFLKAIQKIRKKYKKEINKINKQKKANKKKQIKLINKIKKLLVKYYKIEEYNKNE